MGAPSHTQNPPNFAGIWLMGTSESRVTSSPPLGAQMSLRCVRLQGEGREGKREESTVGSAHASSRAWGKGRAQRMGETDGGGGGGGARRERTC